MQIVFIDYDKLIKDYWDALNTKLRGFSASDKDNFLEEWVPDENDILNIRSILNEAFRNSIETIRIQLSSGTLQKIGIRQMKSFVEQFDGVKLLNESEFSTIVVEKLCQEHLSYLKQLIEKSPKNNFGNSITKRKIFSKTEMGTSEIIHDGRGVGILKSYTEGIRKLSVDPQFFKKTMQQGEDHLISEVLHSGVYLKVLIKKTDHFIVDASYCGEFTLTPMQIGILEGLCKLILWKPIQECSDHATIYLENMLRENSVSKGIRGIIMPTNASPLFKLPLQLIRGVKKKYYFENNLEDMSNEFDLPSSDQWIKLSDVERRNQVQQIFIEYNFDKYVDDFYIEGVEKVIIFFKVKVDPRKKRRFLLILEDLLKQNIERNLHLYLEEKTDLNKIRRVRGITNANV